MSQYTDDRHVGQLFICPLRESQSPSFERAQAAAYVMCYQLIEAGYFIGIEKLQLVPSPWNRFLGFICDSVRQAFLIPEDKKVNLLALREDILSPPFVKLKTLQCTSGKVISSSLAMSGSKLYVRGDLPSFRVYSAFCQGRGGSSLWRFLGNWRDCLP